MNQTTYATVALNNFSKLPNFSISGTSPIATFVSTDSLVSTPPYLHSIPPIQHLSTANFCTLQSNFFQVKKTSFEKSNMASAQAESSDFSK